MKNSFYITTTLPYVNADLHIGHALEFVRADVIARYKKLQGLDVFFNTGTDEHGMKIYEKALSLGKTPQDFVDESFIRFKQSVEILGLDNDILHFIRTTDKHHISAAQEFWKRVYDKGYIYKKNYQAKYCVGCEETKSDSELINGECELHPGRKMEIIDEENYFFKYSEFRDKLLKFYKENPNFVIPDFRFNEVRSFVERGLHDFSISRLKTKLPWGVPVPGDDNQVMYVWFDALVDYISTLGWPDETGNYKKYWIEGTPTQYCGKDNLRFQSAMWQAMLMAAELPNSHQIVINGFINAGEGVRMSKSIGNVVDPKEIVAEYGTDALRYFLLREISSFEDSPFTMERFKDAYNSGLANGLGNLVSRIMTMAETNFKECPIFADNIKTDHLIEEGVSNAIENFNLKEAMDLIWGHISYLDQYIQKEQPFKIIKSDPESARKMISETLIVELYRIARMLESFVPDTAKKIQELIKANKKPDKPLFLRKD